MLNPAATLVTEKGDLTGIAILYEEIYEAVIHEISFPVRGSRFGVRVSAALQP